MTYCPHCGASNKATSTFCNDCGSSLTAPSDARCAVCGATNPRDRSFCATCGATLEPSKPASASSQETRGTEKDSGATSSTPRAPAARTSQWVARVRGAKRSDAPRAAPSGMDEAEIKGEPKEEAATPGHVEENRALPSAADEQLPEWLLELRTAPLDELPNAEPQAAPEPQPGPVKSDDELPEWLIELQSATPDDLQMRTPETRATLSPESEEDTHAPEPEPDVESAPPLDAAAQPLELNASEPEASAAPAEPPGQSGTIQDDEDDPPAADPPMPNSGDGPFPGGAPGGDRSPQPPASTDKSAVPPEAESASDAQDHPPFITPTAPVETIADNDPDWLKELRAKINVPPASSAAGAPAEAHAAELPPEAEAELPDWLGTWDEAQAATVPESQASPAESTSAELPEWLHESAPDQTSTTPVEATALDEGHSAPDDDATFIQSTAAFLHQDAEAGRGADVRPVASAALPPSEELPDWLREAAPSTEILPIAAASEPESEDLPDWLSEFAPELAAKAPPQAEAIAPTAEAESAALGAAAPNVPSEESATPDWVRELEPPREAAEDASLALEKAELEELPDWLREPNAQPDESGQEYTPRVRAEETQTPAFTQEIPAWAEQMRPLQETPEAAGPIAGMMGVLPNALAVVEPHKAAESAAPRVNGGRIFESVLAAPATAPASVPATTRRARGAVPRWIYAVMLLAALVALFLPTDWAGLGLAVNNSTPTAGFYDRLQALAPGSTVLLAFDYETGQAVELDPAARVIVGDLARRQVNVVALSTLPVGAQLAQNILNETARQNTQWQPGRNFVNVGYIPGAEAGLRRLAENWPAADQLDFENQPLGLSPLAAHVKGLRDFALVIEFAGSDKNLQWWMEQVQPRHETTFVAAVSAAADASARNYRDAKQLAAFLRGMQGAAEYELFLNQPGLTVRLMDAQSILHVVLFALIVVGNLAFVLEWLKRSRST
jgi:Double zinc ribbon